VLLYMRTADGNDALGWLDQNGEPVTESPLRVLRAAECTPTTPAIARDERHHALVEAGVQRLAEENPMIGGQLGRPTGARYRTYERLKAYAQRVQGMLFDLPELQRAVDDIYRFPLTSGAIDTLNRQLRSGIGDADLAELVMRLRDDDPDFDAEVGALRAAGPVRATPLMRSSARAAATSSSRNRSRSSGVNTSGDSSFVI